ncbi:MAG: hypothetical protein A2V67_10195 [Deltaproteobacteria bacterium RBG_13_61_14]|nr:MAG: hypothetical protein A2V67_10195 [Deltaproteobacteria bacterium RBG_13_61_14]
MKKTLAYYMELPYEVMLRKLRPEEGGGFLACIPLLGENRCVGDGETPQGALKDLEEVKKDLFADYLKRGEMIPEPAKPDEKFSGKLLLRIPKILHCQLSQAAKENETSLNSYITYLLSSNHASERMTQQFDFICGAIHKLWKWPVISPEDETEESYSNQPYLTH